MTTPRRTFLLIGASTGSAAMFGGIWSSVNAASEIKESNSLLAANHNYGFGGWLGLSEGGFWTVYVPHIDMGQGTHTSLAQIVAENLDIDLRSLKVELAPTEYIFANGALAKGWITGNLHIPTWLNGSADYAFKKIARLRNVQISGGSTAVRYTGQLGLGIVASSARLALMQAAARRWSVPVHEITTGNGRVIHNSSQNSIDYYELAEDATKNGFLGEPELKTTKFRTIGTSPQRIDIPSKIDGSIVYGIDVQIPNLRVAAVRTARSIGTHSLEVNTAPALLISDVEKVITLPSTLIVIAKNWWAANQGLNALTPRFIKTAKDNDLPPASTDSLFRSHDTALKSGKRTGDFKLGNAVKAGQAASSNGGRRVEAVYRVQMLHHAAMEPMSMTAHWTTNHLEIWAGVQDPLSARAFLAKAAGLSFESVTLHALPIGGSFGRRLPKSIESAFKQLIEIAQACAYPVKVIWSREEDFAQGVYRPALSAKLNAVLNPDGLPASWHSVYIRKNTEPDAAHIPYRIDAQEVEWVNDPGEQWDIPVGPWRAVTHVQQTWYTECFIDELSNAAGQDPLSYRLALLAPTSREAVVLRKLRMVSSWGTALPPGEGLGVAVGRGMGSVVAIAVHACLDKESKPKVLKVFAVVDCGLVVHPDTARQQVEGSIVMGLSAAIAEEITLSNGAVQQSNFSNYHILKLADTPAIETHFVGGDRILGGLGEPALPPVAPALANALFVATGIRARQLPLGSSFL